MNCHFCGKSLGLAAAAARDSDFCSSEHRTRYQSRLRKALVLVGGEFPRAPQLAEPLTRFVPVDSPPQPAVLAGPVCRHRLPAVCFAIDPDAGQGPETVPAALAAVAGGAAKPDRRADLGSRLRDLRFQLDRASGVQRRLATA